MTWKRLLALLWLAADGLARAEGPGPTPALEVRLVRPDAQWSRVLALFDGTRAPYPAAALSAWKRATVPPRALSRTWEAAIDAFNPGMVREMRSLDRGELVVGFDRDGGPRWHATLPRDDGTFAALAPALALTDGGREPPIGDLAVDRLGPPGAPLAARSPGALILAGSRDDLVAALRPAPPRIRPDVPGLAPRDSCWAARVDPEGLGPSGPIARRRVGEGLRALGCRVVDAVGGLEGETLSVRVRLPFDRPLPPGPAIDPTWLDGLPTSSLAAAFAWAVDPGREAWDRAFALADRVERADPAHADVAPLRARINLLAAAVKVRPEVDLWPHLRGLSGAVLSDPPGRISGVVLVLHLGGPEAAGRIAGEVIPRLAPLLGLRPEPPAVGDGQRLLGRYRDRPVSLGRRGSTVRLGWGVPAIGDPGPSIGPALRALAPWGDAPPHRFGALWPAKLDLAPTLGEPLARTLDEAPPVFWTGRLDDAGAVDVVSWTGLRDLVRRFLDRILDDPPPGRSEPRHAPD